MKIHTGLSKLQIFTITIFSIVLSAFIYFFSTQFFEKSAFDTMVKFAANKNGSQNIVNVVIDENSLKEVSAWPWERTLYADMFDFLEKSGAKIIVFDAILSNQINKANDDIFNERIKKYNNIIVGVDFTKNENVQNNENELKTFETKFALNVQDFRNQKLKNETEYIGFQEMFPNYLNSINKIGAVNSSLDTDGSIRTFEPVIYMNGKYYPSLPLAVYLTLNNYKKVELYNDYYKVIFNDNSYVKFPLKKLKDKHVQYIKWLAPFDKNSWIPHEQIKASEIIKSYNNISEGKKPAVSMTEFKDKIVVIGATANALYDLKVTPVSINLAGSAIQATAIDNMFSNDSILITNPLINILIILFFVIIIFLLVLYLSPPIAVISIFVTGFIYFYITLFLFSQGIALNVVTPYIFFILAAITTYSYKFTLEDYKKNKLQRAMKKYINTNVVENIIENTDEEIQLGGKKTEVTILMADIRGFTKLSENLDPNEVTKLLNEYFEKMIPIIEEYKGSVNKFIGDAVLAIFNEPIRDKNHPKNAVLCATKMLKAVKELKKKWKQENKPEIDITIGINTGMVFIGNVGTPNHMEYTVIGDTVNVASRIETQNRKFNTQLLISETTYEYTKDMLDVIKISSVEIRGREKHMDIYEIINLIENNETN